jgi:HK97 family phage major capsid protein
LLAERKGQHDQTGTNEGVRGRWRSPLSQFSLELFQDAGNDDDVASAMSVFAEFAASRCARGIGQALVTGSGSGTTLGLIPSLISAGVSGVVAAGSSANDGGSGTGANSIGSQDLARLYFSVAEPYRYSPKCAWILNDTTALFLSKQLDKQGRPLISLDGPGPVTLLGKRVLISPSMASIGSEAITITFGDMSYWNTRLTGGRIQVFKETYVERGIVALQYYLRADGCLAFAGDPNNSPINYLIQHS